MFFVNLVNWVFTQTHRWRYSDVCIKLSRLQVLLPSQWFVTVSYWLWRLRWPPRPYLSEILFPLSYFPLGSCCNNKHKTLNVCICFMWECSCLFFHPCLCAQFYNLLRTLLISSLRPCFLFILEYMQLHLSLSFLSPDNNFFRRASFTPSQWICCFWVYLKECKMIASSRKGRQRHWKRIWPPLYCVCIHFIFFHDKRVKNSEQIAKLPLKHI